MNFESTVLHEMDKHWATLPIGEVVRREPITGHVEFIFAWEEGSLRMLTWVSITRNGALRETVQIKDSRSLLASETKMQGAHFVNLYEMRKSIRGGTDKETVVRTALEATLRSLQANPSRTAHRLRRKEWQPIGGAVNMPFSIVQGGAPGLGKRA